MISEAGDSHDVVLLAVVTFESVGNRTRALRQLEQSLRSGLPLHEVQAHYGLVELRRDAGYRAMLERLHLNPGADPGGLTPSKTGCPEPARAGEGLQGP